MEIEPAGHAASFNGLNEKFSCFDVSILTKNLANEMMEKGLERPWVK